jgi:hypothetical protein
MSTLEERKIAALEAEIRELADERKVATTEVRRDRLLDAITARSQVLHDLLQAAAAAAGNYTARDLTSFI